MRVVLDRIVGLEYELGGNAEIEGIGDAFPDESGRADESLFDFLLVSGDSREVDLGEFEVGGDIDRCDRDEIVGDAGVFDIAEYNGEFLFISSLMRPRR